MVELNPEATQAATGAFAERIGTNPTTGDLMAALRFALEAYESVRVAPAPASQHDSDAVEKARRDALIYGVGAYMQNPDGTTTYIRADDVRFIEMPNVPMRSILPQLPDQAGRAQRTDKPS